MEVGDVVIHKLSNELMRIDKIHGKTICTCSLFKGYEAKWMSKREHIRYHWTVVCNMSNLKFLFNPTP